MWVIFRSILTAYGSINQILADHLDGKWGSIGELKEEDEMITHMNVKVNVNVRWRS